MIYLELFWTFFYIGAFTFGGGYAMLPLIQEEVLRRGWIAEEKLLDMVAISESTPGPFAVNMATYIGAEQGSAYGTLGGILGAACATLGVVLPSFLVILAVARCYDRFRQSRVVRGCMSGLKPATVGLIGGAVLSVFLTVFFPAGWTVSVFATASFYISAGLFGAMLILALKKVHPILIICISAVAGIIVGYLHLW